MIANIIFSCLLLLLGGVWTAPPSEQDYEPDYSDEIVTPSCEVKKCQPPNCSCFGVQPDVPVKKRPQFVMLTFDDAITVANIGTYRKIIEKRRNKRGGRNITMTFFVCHEYNDYSLTNALYQEGHEIAVHSISHESNTDLWRDATEEKWTKEMAGMRTMLKTYGGIPQEEIVGHRAPFLQTAGNITFRVLKTEGFLYDSSMPTRNYMEPPIWPYTLDYGYRQDCQIQPCPTEFFEGIWIVPMIQYRRKSKDGDFFCSMVDACTPQPTTASDTKEFLLQNFERHYKNNRAPFPVFLHEGWLREEGRLNGYLQFLDEILEKDDVFVVSIREVIEYMKKPVTVEEYRARTAKGAEPCEKSETCAYKKPLRNMKSCISCPKYYPWVGTPLGRRPPKGFLDYN